MLLNMTSDARCSGKYIKMYFRKSVSRFLTKYYGKSIKTKMKKISISMLLFVDISSYIINNN